MPTEKKLTGYPSIDKPWLKYYTEEAINAPAPDKSLFEYMYEQNKKHLSDIALNYFGTKITYKTLFEQIDVVAKAFVAQGVKSGDICTIVSISCVQSILCFYALNKIGAVSNFINVLSSQEDLETYFKDSESNIVLTLDLFGEKVVKAAKMTGVKKVIAFSMSNWMPYVIRLGFAVKMRKLNKSFMQDPIILSWDNFLLGAKGQPEINYQKTPDSLCCLAHTGGTTGFPKTVLLNDLSLNILAQQYEKTIVHERQQIFLSLMIPFVIYGALSNIHMPLCLGLQTVIIPKFDAAEWPQYIKKYHPNHLTAIPPYISPMLENKKLSKMDLSCLITVGLGGDGLNVPLEEKINAFLKERGSSAKVVKGYGMTEICATLGTCNNYANKIGSIGFPFPCNNLMIYDNDKQKELAYGEIGEICLQSAACMMGYKDNPEAMNELFKTHSDGKQWIHTGDLGYVDEEGFLFLIGRMKRIILTSREGIAYKVFPNIIEEVLNRHPAVHNTCIVSAKNNDDLVLRAYVALTPDNQAQQNGIEHELQSICSNELSDYMRPYYYEFVEKLPLTAAGKVDYRALEERSK